MVHCVEIFVGIVEKEYIDSRFLTTQLPIRSLPLLKRRLMDFLACPMCKSYPFELHVFEENEEIVEGLLVCPNDNCRMWYPIIEEIPHCLPPDLRDEKDDLAFLHKWKNKVPERVLKNGAPFNLSKESLVEHTRHKA